MPRGLPQGLRNRIPLRLKQAYWRIDRRLFVWKTRRLSRGERFSRIFATNRWGDRESVSGPGSSLANTDRLRQELPLLVEELGVTSLLDAPCGDANWISQVRLPVKEYHGVDIVPGVVELARQRRFPEDGCVRTFAVRDIVNDDLPRADLVLCRDTLIHLSNVDAVQAVQNFRRSGARYLLANIDLRLRRNRDIVTGNTRPVNPSIAPFDLGAPLKVIAGGKGLDGQQEGLGLWDLSPSTGAKAASPRRAAA